MIRAKRVYDKPEKEDGRRILVDRMWPRGLSKESAGIDLWLKDLAPSPGLRKWFGHRPERWPEFKSRYAGELEGEEAAPALDELRAQKGKTVTLLFAARDREHNNALALLEYLARKTKSK